MAQWPEITDLNVSSTTRKMWIPNVVSQVVFKMPLAAKMYMSGGVKKEWNGGTLITRPVLIDDLSSLAQSFGEEDQLTGGRKTLLKTPSFGWKSFQVPLVYTKKQADMNAGPNRVLDFSKFLVQQGFLAARIHMCKMMYNGSGAGGAGATQTASNTGALGAYTGAVTQSGDGDAHVDFQSIIHALDHGDVTASSTGDLGYQYGNVTRDLSGNTVDCWQSADINSGFDGTGTTSVQDTEITASIGNFRKALSVVRRNIEPASQFLCVVGPTLYQAFQSIVGAGVSITKGSGEPGDLVKFGFNSFTLDNIEVVEDPFLVENNRAVPSVTTMSKWFFIYHVPSWELRFKPGDMFRLTAFQDQAVMINGYAQHMARIYGTGNFMCWQPNANIMLTNMVPAS